MKSFKTQCQKSLAGLLLLVLILTTSCSDPNTVLPPTVFEGTTMGTDYRVSIATTSKSPSIKPVGLMIEDELEAINEAMSTYREDSEISRFNDYEGTDWFPVSSATAEVVAAALEIWEETDGAFDVTVGALSDRWGFGPASPSDIPGGEEIEALLQETGSEHLQVRSDPPALLKNKAFLKIDLSALAKGYAVDRIVVRLNEEGFAHCLVEIGGEIRASGMKNPTTPWTVAILNPELPTELQRVLPLNDQALATSGDYHNYRVEDGQQLPHIIDPRTGRPTQSNVASASVLASTCLEADALATALLVMGPDGSREVSKQRDTQVLLMTREGNQLSEFEIGGFPDQDY